MKDCSQKICFKSSLLLYYSLFPHSHCSVVFSVQKKDDVQNRNPPKTLLHLAMTLQLAHRSLHLAFSLKRKNVDLLHYATGVVLKEKKNPANWSRKGVQKPGIAANLYTTFFEWGWGKRIICWTYFRLVTCLHQVQGGWTRWFVRSPNIYETMVPTAFTCDQPVCLQWPLSPPSTSYIHSCFPQGSENLPPDTLYGAWQGRTPFPSMVSGVPCLLLPALPPYEILKVKAKK